MVPQGNIPHQAAKYVFFTRSIFFFQNQVDFLQQKYFFKFIIIMLQYMGKVTYILTVLFVINIYKNILI